MTTDAAPAVAPMTSPDDMAQSVSWLIHGTSKCGKSTLADTQPRPHLHFDAEGGMGTRFTPSRKKLWDPTRQEPPVYDGSWDTCVVHVRDYQTVKFGYDWLNSGLHPFVSVTLDSVSEIQQRGVDSMVGKDVMKIQDWGELLREVSALVRSFRDLANHPTRPIQSVMLITMTTNKDNKWRPYVQGQLADRLPYYVDVCGYLYAVQGEDGNFVRRLLVSQHAEFEAGERVGGRLGLFVENPNISNMIDVIFNGAALITTPNTVPMSPAAA